MDYQKELEAQEIRQAVVDDLVWFSEWRDALEINEPFSYEDEESRESMRKKIEKRIKELNARFEAPDYELKTDEKKDSID